MQLLYCYCKLEYKSWNLLSLSKILMVALGENINARGSVVFNSKKKNSVSSRIPSLFTNTSMHCCPSAVNRSTSETGVKSLPSA